MTQPWAKKFPACSSASGALAHLVTGFTLRASKTEYGTASSGHSVNNFSLLEPAAMIPYNHKMTPQGLIENRRGRATGRIYEQPN
jgi:hypothetical protein